MWDYGTIFSYDILLAWPLPPSRWRERLWRLRASARVAGWLKNKKQAKTNNNNNKGYTRYLCNPWDAFYQCAYCVYRVTPEPSGVESNQQQQRCNTSVIIITVNQARWERLHVIRSFLRTLWNEPSSWLEHATSRYNRLKSSIRQKR